MKKLNIVTLSILVMSSIGQASAKESLLKAHVERAKETPDICQGDVPNGRNFCGPAVVSNGMIWLSKKGFPNLFDGGDDPGKAQVRLVKKLARAEYMDSALGTGITKMAYAIGKYLKQKGIKKYRVDYEGWRSIGKKTKRLSKIPKLSTINKILNKNSAVFLNIGRYEKRDGDYHRSGGHWLTVVGVDKKSIWAFDPASRRGSEKKLHRLSLDTINGGALKGKYKGMPLAAKGYLLVTDKGIAKTKNEKTIIDGILYLTIKDAPVAKNAKP